MRSCREGKRGLGVAHSQLGQEPCCPPRGTHHRGCAWRPYRTPRVEEKQAVLSEVALA